MSTQQQPAPTQEQIRAARREGFKTSVDHMPAERRDRFVQSHTKQDTNRERNVSGFYKSVIGDRKA